MNRAQVKSSFIVSIGYSKESRTLEVEFKAGRVYQYKEVPAAVYDELMAAHAAGESIGKRFPAIASCYEHERVDVEKEVADGVL